MPKVKITAIFLTLIIAGCPKTSKNKNQSRPGIRVFVSILPQAYFVKRIGGPSVAVEVLVGPGRSPATYQPTSKQMAKLARAQLYFRAGVPFEKTLLKKIEALHKKIKIVDTGQPSAFHRAGSSQPAHCGSEATDPHSWLDPRWAGKQAAIISRELSRLAPAQATRYSINLARLSSDLRRIEARISRLLSPLKGAKFFVYHPAYGHFAERFGLKQVAIERGGHQPGARHLAALITTAKKLRAKDIFVQPQFSRRTAKTIARTLGGRVVRLDPLARDYMKNLIKMANQIKRSLTRAAK